MRILFVSSETPLFPAGGIATYLEYMVPALMEAGHDVFLFTFRDQRDYGKQGSFEGLSSDRIHIEWISDNAVHDAFPSVSHDLSTSYYIADQIEDCVCKWNIDVVETTDWQAPCLALFQKLQSKKNADKVLLSVFNHGLSQTVWEADQLGVPNWAQTNSLNERQQMRVSDLVIVPSTPCKRRLDALDIKTPMSFVREPYAFRIEKPNFNEVQNEIQYMGRFSIAKGIDQLIYIANILNSVRRLRRIEILGRITFTSFRERDIVKYTRSRLHPELRDRFFYSDFKPRDVALDQLRSGTISPHLGTAETFSYACVEAIDAGQLPIVRHGTAMAEFFPEEMYEYVLDEQMRSVRDIQNKLEKIIEDGPNIANLVRAYCKKTLAPNVVAENLGKSYAEALDRKRGWHAQAVPDKRADIKDVTVLIPAYKPNHEFMETIDSLASQSAGIPNVIICDDGTPETHQSWFDYARSMLPDARIVSQPNSGLLAARNTLIEECDTPLSIFIDTDDMFGPNLLENMLETWNETSIQQDAVIPLRQNFGENNELILRHTLGDYLHFLENDYRMTALIRTDILKEIGFDGTRRNGEADDWVFWLDFDSRGYKAMLLPEAGFLYRFKKGSMSWPWSEGQKVGTQTMIRKVVTDACL